MKTLEKTDKDFEWIVQHSIELQSRYAGKWIAVVDEEVVGAGDTATEADKQAKKKYPNAKPLLGVVPTEEALIL